MRSAKLVNLPFRRVYNNRLHANFDGDFFDEQRVIYRTPVIGQLTAHDLFSSGVDQPLRGH